jgi:outer membrane protein assembly factor BamB
MLLLLILLSPVVCHCQDQPELIWRYSAGGRIYSSQAEGPDGTIYLISESRGLHALSPVNGLLKWLFRPGGKFLPFIVTSPDGTIYVASEKKELYAVNPGGAVRWVFHMKDKPVTSPGVMPDGSLVIVFPDKQLQIISRKGILLRKFSIETLPLFPLILFEDQAMAWYGEDRTLRMASLDGKTLLTVSLQTIDTVLMYHTADKKFYLGSLDGKITGISLNGTVEILTCPVSERIVFLLEHPSGLVAGTADGSFWIIDKQRNFILVGKGPNPGGCGAVNTLGHCFYPSAGGGLVISNKNDIAVMDLETTVTAPLLSADGYLVFGGADWVLYGYKTERSYSGWSQEGGDPSRNGGSALDSAPIDPDLLYGNRGDYHYYRYLLDNGGIDNLWIIVDDLKKYKNREALEKNIPFYAILLEELCGIGTIFQRQSRVVPTRDSSLIRGEAYMILATVDDFRFRNILLTSLAAEEDPLALSMGFRALGIMGVDFDGRSMALISGKTISCLNLDDRLALEAAESLKEIKFYNGMITNQAAYVAMDYLINAPQVSRVTRKKIYGIFKLMF